MVAVLDATLVAEGGVRLPVHTAYLSAVSPVLLNAFTVEEVGVKRKRVESVELSAPFKDFSAQEVALFLRNAYRGSGQQRSLSCPEEAACLLPGVLRLAHQLQADAMPDAITSHVLSPERFSAGYLAEFSVAAEACQMDWAQHDALDMLAAQLQAPDTAAGALAAASRLSSRSLEILARQLMLLNEGDNFTVFSWTLHGFSDLAPPTVYSPPFHALGGEWEVWVSPTGSHAGAGTHLSVGVYCNRAAVGRRRQPAPVTAAIMIQLHGANSSQAVVREFAARKCFAGEGAQRAKFISLERLHDAQYGYLENNQLRLSVQVSSP